MIKLAGFVIKIVLLVALVIWLADRPGTAQIVWRDYVIETSAAVLAVIVAAIAYVFVLLNRLWRLLLDGPYLWRLKRQLGKKKDGETALLLALASVAASQPAEAGKQAAKARKLLGETPLTSLLLAQSAQLAGDGKTAKTLYEGLAQDPDAAPLGYRGLITAALRERNFDEASRLCARFESLKGEVPWLNLIRFEIATRLENWAEASQSLEKAKKAKALAAPVANKHQAALLLADAKAALRDSNAMKALELSERAFKLAPDWPPGALILAEAQIVTKHEKAALRTLEKAWARVPHPQLIPLLHWAMEGAGALAHYKYVERLARNSLTLASSRHALAEAALRADLWGEARRHLMALLHANTATQTTYQILARLESRERRDEKTASSWMSKAVSAPADPMWLCSTCGAAHEYWEPTCQTCASFNTMSWEVPGRGSLQALEREPRLMVEPIS